MEREHFFLQEDVFFSMGCQAEMRMGGGRKGVCQLKGLEVGWASCKCVCVCVYLGHLTQGREGLLLLILYWKFRWGRSRVQSVLVKKSRSSAEKFTGLSKNPWRLGESPSEVCGQESTEEKRLRSGDNKGDFWLSRKALSEEEEEAEEERAPAVPFGSAVVALSSGGVK